MASYPLYRIGFWIRETGQALDKVGCFLQGNASYAEEVCRHRTLLNLFNRRPAVSSQAFVAPSASLVGDVSVGQGSSVWYGTVLRGDAGKITVGSNTSIQDGTVIRTAVASALGHGDSHAAHNTVIGNNVTIGHQVSMHAATVEDNVLIGIGATLLDGSKVEKGAIVAAGAVVQPGAVVPAGELWAGNPARKLRAVKPKETEYLSTVANAYVGLGEQHTKAVPKDLQGLIEAAEAQMKA
jgi:carbonic anhydrase/acetyltransferase-like protein (isoleucine patch superfamily)